MALDICVVTGSRADYGLLYWLMRDIRDDPDLRLQLAVTGSHLAPEFGNTVNVIIADGFSIDARVECILASDSASGMSKSIGLGVLGFAEVFARLNPALVVLLGDRFEIFAAAQAALMARIPIAHICGGDVTEGALDEAMRHSITKMSQLHFVTNEQARRRVCQLGEDPACVFNVGSPGIDYIRRTSLLDRREVEAQLGVSLLERVLLVTFHPATLDIVPSEEQFAELLRALDAVGTPPFSVVFTKPNADAGSRSLIRMIDDYVSARAEAHAFESLGQQLFLSLMALSGALVGNSSSGLYEAPSLKIPSVNIGDRQKGRLAAESVVSCAPVARDIEASIREALAKDCSRTVNPYGDGEATRQIIAKIKGFPDPGILVRKRFFDLGAASERP